MYAGVDSGGLERKHSVNLAAEGTTLDPKLRRTVARVAKDTQL